MNRSNVNFNIQILDHSLKAVPEKQIAEICMVDRKGYRSWERGVRYRAYRQRCMAILFRRCRSPFARRAIESHT
jgi:hypothetical protein